MIVTLAPLQNLSTMTNISQYYYKLLHHISPLCLGSHCRHNCFHQHRGCMKGCDYCGTQTRQPKESHSSCGSCSHWGIGPQLSSPQLMSWETGESWKNPLSSVVLSPARSRRCLSVLMWACSSLRNLIIVSRSLSLVAVVLGGRDAVAAYWMCNWQWRKSVISWWRQMRQSLLRSPSLARVSTQ